MAKQKLFRPWEDAKLFAVLVFFYILAYFVSDAVLSFLNITNEIASISIASTVILMITFVYRKRLYKG